jgi:DNA repair protein RecO (recombination protein O)
LVQIDTEAIVCGVRGHGEHGTIVRMLSADHGMVAAYVRGGRGRRVRPILIPGNTVSAQLRWRTENQLPQAMVELVQSRAPILSEPLPSAGIDWVTSLVTAALPERQPYPRLYQAMGGLLDAIEAAPSAIGWSSALVRFEQLLVAEVGYARPETDFIEGQSPAGWSEILAALNRSSRQLFGELLTGRVEALQDSRSRLLDRLARAAR